MRARVRQLRLPPPELAGAIRRAAGITQAEVADMLGVHVLTVWRWEHGHRRPRGEMARRYRAALDAMQSEAVQ